MSPVSQSVVPYNPTTALENMLEHLRYDYTRHAALRNAMAQNPPTGQLTRSRILFGLAALYGSIVFFLMIFNINQYFLTQNEKEQIAALSTTIVVFLFATWPIFTLYKKSKEWRQPIQLKQCTAAAYPKFPHHELVEIAIDVFVPEQFASIIQSSLPMEFSVFLQHHFDALALLPNLSPDFHYDKLSPAAIDHIITPLLYGYWRSRNIPILTFRTCAIKIPKTQIKKLIEETPTLEGIIIGSR